MGWRGFGESFELDRGPESRSVRKLCRRGAPRSRRQAVGASARIPRVRNGLRRRFETFSTTLIHRDTADATRRVCASCIAATDTGVQAERISEDQVPTSILQKVKLKEDGTFEVIDEKKE